MNPSKISFEQFARFWTAWVPFGAYSALVFGGAVLPPNRVPHFLLRVSDKLLHASQYFLLFFFAVRAFAKSEKPWLRDYFVRAAFVYCLLMGGATECAQHFVPGRSMEFSDWLVDALGAGSALLLYEKLSPQTLLKKGKNG